MTAATIAKAADSVGINAIEQARADVVWLHARECTLFADWQMKKAELAAARVRAGVQVADGDTAASGAEIALVVADIQAFEEGLEEVRRRRRAAILNVWQAESADLKRQAAEKRAQASRPLM